MIPRNQASIRRKTIRFWMLFLLLMVFTALPALCFVWTASARYRRQHATWQEYQEQLQRGNVLYSKTNSMIDAVNAVQSDEPVSYRKQIDELFRLTTDMTKLAGADSATLFLGYMHMAQRANALLLLKYTQAVKQARLDRLAEDARRNEQVRIDLYNHRR